MNLPNEPVYIQSHRWVGCLDTEGGLQLVCKESYQRFAMGETRTLRETMFFPFAPALWEESTSPASYARKATGWNFYAGGQAVYDRYIEHGL